MEKQETIYAIGQRIKRRREEINMTQQELASLVGYKSRSSINKIELGKNDIVQSTIQKIADALDCTPAYLMGWTETTEGFKANFKSSGYGETHYYTPFLSDTDKEQVVNELRKLGYKISRKVTSKNPAASTIHIVDLRAQKSIELTDSDFDAKSGESPKDIARKISDLISGDFLKRFYELSSSDTEDTQKMQTALDLLLNIPKNKVDAAIRMLEVLMSVE